MTDLYQEIENLKAKMFQEQQEQNNKIEQFTNLLLQKIHELEQRIVQLELNQIISY